MDQKFPGKRSKMSSSSEEHVAEDGDVYSMARMNSRKQKSTNEKRNMGLEGRAAVSRRKDANDMLHNTPVTPLLFIGQNQALDAMDSLDHARDVGYATHGAKRGRTGNARIRVASARKCEDFGA